MAQSILAEFEAMRPLYVEFGGVVHELVGALLREADVGVHVLTHRVKEPLSLEGKINRPEKHYESLSDITDLLGIRVITYMQDDVDNAAKVIEDEFAVDAENSVDKRHTKDPDRFGYASVHKVCTISEQRAGLPEYSRFAGLAFEIQIRSVLQHAWAEIEHDLGYKSKNALPRHLRRRFSILAGMLELADLEFLRLRNELSDYKAEVTEQVETGPADVSLDSISLAEFVKRNPRSLEADRRILSLAGALGSSASGSFLESRVEELQANGVTTAGALEQALASFGGKAVDLARAVLRKGEYERLSAGIGLFYLNQLLAVKDSASLEDAVRQLQAKHLALGADALRRAETIRKVLQGETAAQ